MPGRNRPSQTPEGVKARQLRLVAQAPKVECACGCGEMIPGIHRNGTARKYHAGWRGGAPGPRGPNKKEYATKVTPRGYIAEYAYGRGWVHQHRLVWEREHGDLGDRVVHHVNGNKTDNRIENLEAMTRAEHDALHSSGK